MKAYVQGVASWFRGEALLQQCRQLGLEAEFVPGIDARDMSDEELRQVCDERRSRVHCGRMLSKPEVACALGHIEMYRRMLAEGHEWALMLEDDASIAPEVNQVILQLPTLPNRSIVTLRHEDAGALVCWPSLSRNRPLRRLVAVPYGSSAYLIHRDAAALAVADSEAYGVECVPDWPLRWAGRVHWYVSIRDLSPHAANPSSLVSIRKNLVDYVSPYGDGGLGPRLQWARQLRAIGYPVALAMKVAVSRPLAGRILRVLLPRATRPDFH